MGRGNPQKSGPGGDLHAAARSGDLIAVQSISISNPLSVNSRDKHSRTPLHLAAFSGQTEVVSYLCKNKADVGASAMDDMAAIHFAAQKGHLEVVRALVSAGASFKAATRKGMTPLHFAAQGSHLELVKYLAKKGASLSLKTKAGKTPMDLATNDEVRSFLEGFVKSDKNGELRNGDKAEESNPKTAEESNPKENEESNVKAVSSLTVTVTIVNLGLLLLWYFLQIIVSTWYYILAVGNLFESHFISYGVLKKYKSLRIGKLRYLAIVIESEDAYQTSKVVKLLQWLDSIGVKNVCLYDMNGVLKKSKVAIFQEMKNAKPIEEVNEAVTHHVPDRMTLEFVSYADGKEAVTKAANLIFVENLKRHDIGGELDWQILLEPHLNQALQIVGCKGPEPDLLLVYGPVRSHLGFPAWRIRYTEIVHMGSLNLMTHGSLTKAIYNFTKVHQNYGT